MELLHFLDLAIFLPEVYVDLTAKSSAWVVMYVFSAIVSPGFFFVRCQKNSAQKNWASEKTEAIFTKKTQPAGGFNPLNETKLEK